MNHRIEMLKEELNSIVETFIEEHMNPVSAEQFAALMRHMDQRAFSRHNLFYNDEGILILGDENVRQFNYYAGGEYIDEYCVTKLSGAVFYSAEDERVQEVIDAIEGKDS